LIATDDALVSLLWGSAHPENRAGRIDGTNDVISATETQLREYFERKRTQFSIPLFPQGTDFQKRVWQELLKIPYGQSISYGEQAERVGRPKAARAVGAANGKNPIGILIPCHRVLGASGALTGFAGGVRTKQKLLMLEGNPIASPDAPY
jgi:methylated-DNA-[protein]-cysteine S-methyltransferase